MKLVKILLYLKLFSKPDTFKMKSTNVISQRRNTIYVIYKRKM